MPRRSGKTFSLYSLLEPAFIAAGLLGVLRILSSVPELPYSLLAVLLLSGATLLAFYAVSRIGVVPFWLLFLVFAGVLVRYVYVRADAFLLQIYTAGNLILHEEGPRTADLTPLIAAGGAAAAALLSALEYTAGSHIIACALMTSVPALARAAGLRVDIPAILGIGSFQVFFFALSGIRAKRAEREEAPIYRSALLAVLLFGVLLLPALPLAGRFSPGINETVFKAEGYAENLTNRLLEDAFEEEYDGHVNRGNWHAKGEREIAVGVDGRPDEVIYLKHFTGGDYAAGDWGESREEEVLAEMVREMGWEDYLDWTLRMAPQLVFVRNYGVQRWYRLGSAGEEPGEMSLRYLKSELSDGVRPYFSSASPDGINGPEAVEGEDACWFYTASQIRPALWEEKDEDAAADMLSTVRALEEAYGEYVPPSCLAVPTEELPLLTAYVREHPMEGLREITAFIAYTLGSYTSYSRTPGLTPVGEDAVEYFLFGGRMGYCQHYASAAVLLYRLYGIPARYATGYRVSPQTFAGPEEDGTYRVTLTDESRHAWAEIYLEGYGWFPVEMTPGVSYEDLGQIPPAGSEEAEYLAKAGIPSPHLPGISEADLLAVMEEKGWIIRRNIGERDEGSVPVISPEAVQPETETEETEADGEDLDDGGENDRDAAGAGEAGGAEEAASRGGRFLRILLLILLAAAVCTALYFGIPCLLRARRRAALARIGRLDMRSLYEMLIRLAAKTGAEEEICAGKSIPPDSEEYASLLAAKTGAVTAEALRTFRRAAEQSAFGPGEPDAEICDACRHTYLSAAASLAAGAGGARRSVLRYIGGFGV